MESGRDASIVEPLTAARELLVQWVRVRIDDEIIRELRAVKGLTLRKVARLVGLSKTQVIRRLCRMGIRGRSEVTYASTR